MLTSIIIMNNEHKSDRALCHIYVISLLFGGLVCETEGTEKENNVICNKSSFTLILNVCDICHIGFSNTTNLPVFQVPPLLDHPHIALDQPQGSKAITANVLVLII